MKRLLAVLLFVGAVVGVILGTQGCDSKAAAETPKRFVVVYAQWGDPGEKVILDTWTGACWLRDGGKWSIAPAPKEVCEATGR